MNDEKIRAQAEWIAKHINVRSSECPPPYTDSDCPLGYEGFCSKCWADFLYRWRKGEVEL